MASGMIVHFTINPDLVGIAIGKKGARIKQVEKDSGVTSVNVDGKSGTEQWRICQICRLMRVHLSISFIIRCSSSFLPFPLLSPISFRFCPATSLTASIYNTYVLHPTYFYKILTSPVFLSPDYQDSPTPFSQYFTHHFILSHTHNHTHTGQITVVGPDAPSVQQAREMLELFTETFELKTHQIEYLSHDYSMLGEFSLS